MLLVIECTRMIKVDHAVTSPKKDYMVNPTSLREREKGLVQACQTRGRMRPTTNIFAAQPI